MLRDAPGDPILDALCELGGGRGGGGGARDDVGARELGGLRGRVDADDGCVYDVGVLKQEGLELRGGNWVRLVMAGHPEMWKGTLESLEQD